MNYEKNGHKVSAKRVQNKVEQSIGIPTYLILRNDRLRPCDQSHRAHKFLIKKLAEYQPYIYRLNPTMSVAACMP